MVAQTVTNKPATRFLAGEEQSFRDGRGVTSAQFQRLRRLADLTRLDLTAIDPSTGEILESTNREQPALIPSAVWKNLRATSEPHVIEISRKLLCCVFPLPDAEKSPATAIGFAWREARSVPPEVVFAAVEANWNQEKLNSWVNNRPVCSTELLDALCRAADRDARLEDRVAALKADLDDAENRLDHTYEEVGLLHGLAHNLQLSRRPAELAQLCLSRLHALIHPAGTALWIEDKQNTSEQFFVRGKVPFDEIGMAQIVARFESHEWSRPLFRENIDRTLLGADFPGLRNLVLAPISDGTHRFGWIICCNLPDGRESGTVESSLLTSVSMILGTHVRNIDLYQQHEDLLLSFVRSLVSSLDAKDPYTRGHSERVALIARRLGQQLELAEEDLQDIYLSGLLHDIGKIGVDDRILQKTDKLTEEELWKIQQHPMIGYSILLGLKNLRRILPGVRNHHEMFDGAGYPDRLCGEEIPMMARILAVADSYDAMGSDRPYRKGMPVPRIEEIFTGGAGSQWDPKVIEAYFACRDDIRRICLTYSPEDGNLLPQAIA